MLTPSRIGYFEWWAALAFFGFIDLVQIILNFFLIGGIVNRLDFIVGGLMVGYLYIRGYKFDMNDWLWVGATMLAEEIPVIDSAPFWCVDVYRFRSKDIARREAQESSLEDSAEA